MFQLDRRIAQHLPYYWLMSFLLLFTAPIQGESTEILIVNYATAHMNSANESVCGVLVTPSGAILKTDPLDPYNRDKIVLVEPEEGGYSAYFEALVSFKPRVCYVVGGIEANLCNQPGVKIAFTPSKSHIQEFDHRKSVKVGDKTLPIATFEIYR